MTQSTETNKKHFSEFPKVNCERVAIMLRVLPEIRDELNRLAHLEKKSTNQYIKEKLGIESKIDPDFQKYVEIFNGTQFCG